MNIQEARNAASNKLFNCDYAVALGVRRADEIDELNVLAGQIVSGRNDNPVEDKPSEPAVKVSGKKGNKPTVEDVPLPENPSN